MSRKTKSNFIELETNKRLIKTCLDGNQKARKELYDLYSPQMMSICRRYMKDEEEAKDVFQQAFFSVYKNLAQVKNPKALSGWIKQTFIHTALNRLKQKKRDHLINEQSAEDIRVENWNEALDKLAVDVIMKLIENLPTGCRTVFNMYAIDGYAHKEIAKELGISEGTSKSQLHDARKSLQAAIHKNSLSKINLNSK